MADALHIQQMVARARALGAGSAAPLPARAVVVAERVNLQSRVPLCASYGVNHMCPPNTPTAAETRTVLARYSDTRVVQLDIPLTQAAVDEVLEGMGYAEAQAPGAAAGPAGAADPGGNGGGAGGNAQTAAYDAVSAAPVAFPASSIPSSTSDEESAFAENTETLGGVGEDLVDCK